MAPPRIMRLADRADGPLTAVSPADHMAPAAGRFTGVGGGPVYAKTGTAEFGSGSSPQTHAWLVGWQGDIAFAAFVEAGRSGGSVAAPVVRDFLTALHAR